MKLDRSAPLLRTHTRFPFVLNIKLKIFFWVYKVGHMLICVRPAGFALHQLSSLSRMPHPHPLLGWLYSSFRFQLKTPFFKEAFTEPHLKMYCSFLAWSRKSAHWRWLALGLILNDGGSDHMKSYRKNSGYKAWGWSCLESTWDSTC